MVKKYVLLVLMIMAYFLVIIAASFAFIRGVDGEDFTSLIITAIGANLTAIGCHIAYLKLTRTSR